MEYISGSGDADPEGCVFCDHLAQGDDEKARILYRGHTTFVILNAFPYNTGHLMVAPSLHVGSLTALTPAERAEMMELASSATKVVRAAMGAQGFNVGINVGEAAGAGIPGHLHMHVVPRWGGDTNFMTTIGDTKVLPEMLDDTYKKLRPGFDALTL